jgi:aspartyl-tRNA(Asn)/glutamyl-tRNA(Gln) amidotransferase subunit A
MHYDSTPRNAADLTIAEAGERLRTGALTSVALTEAHLARIAERDPTLHAFVTVTAERALEDASRADREIAEGRDRGLLHGIPIALKDLIDTRGIRTTSGSRLREHHVPRDDAAVVTRLVDGGAVLLGKLTTYEMATVGPDFATPFPPARNPWSLDHITGGSSSGSAAAVAGGLVRTTIGSDTAGSVRGPASYCGVVGLKLTGGLIPTDGVFPLSPSLDTLGPISATVAEAAQTLDAIAGTAAAVQLGEGIIGQRIGYARAWFATDPETEPAVLGAMDAAASSLSLLGAKIEEIDLPDYARLSDAAATILNAESYALHRDDLENRPGDYGPMSRDSLLRGRGITDDVLAAARADAVGLGEELVRSLAPFAAIITACTLKRALPVSAFREGRVVWTPMRTMPFNLSGHPVLALPIGFHDGLPMGMQIVGRHHDEAAICRIGAAFESATDHSVQRPGLFKTFGAAA